MSDESIKPSDEAIQAYLDGEPGATAPAGAAADDLNLYRALYAELGAAPPSAVLANDISDAVMARISQTTATYALVRELPSGPGPIILLPALAALLAVAGFGGSLPALGQVYGITVDHQASVLLLQHVASLMLDAAPLFYGLLTGGAVALLDRYLRRHLSIGMSTT